MLSKFIVFYLIFYVLAEEEERVITTLNHTRFRVQPTSVRGKTAPRGHFSYLVSIKRSFQKVTENKYLWSTYCGGAIIHPSKVLTAGHCFDMKNYYYLTRYNLLRCVAGSSQNHIEHPGFTTDTKDQQWRQITEVLMHKEFHFPVNDIALLSVDQPFDYNRVISYYNPLQSDTEDYENNRCFTAGFGQIGIVAKNKISKVLMWADIHLLSKSRCSAIWGMNMDKFVCSDTVFSDISGGDSGGPLACILSKRKTAKENDNRNYVLVGIASGKNSDKTRLYTRVAAYQNWIDGLSVRAEPSNSTQTKSFLVLVFVSLIKFTCTCFDGFYWAVTASPKE